MDTRELTVEQLCKMARRNPAGGMAAQEEMRNRELNWPRRDSRPKKVQREERARREAKERVRIAKEQADLQSELLGKESPTPEP